MSTTSINHETEAAKWAGYTEANLELVAQAMWSPEAVVGNATAQALLAVHHDLNRLAEVLEQMQASQRWER